MLRLRLLPSDLRNVRLAAAPAAVLELTNQLRVPGLTATPERRDELTRRGLRPPDLALFGHLFGAACSPGFLHPDVADPHAAIDAIAATPPATVRRDLDEMATLGYPRQTWTLDLASPGRAGTVMRSQLSATMSGLLSAVVVPRLENAQSQVDARRQQLREVRERVGVAGLLNALDGWIRYRPPFLEVDLRSGAEVEAVSRGDGLILVPSLAAVPTVTVSSSGKPTVVTYSLTDRELPDRGCPPAGDLVRLIGRSRAAVLQAIALRPGVGTRETARLLGLSPATISEHVTVLRANGLVDTVSTAAGACHVVTPLGHDLLRAGA